jgi:hypothetical protein
MATLEFITSGTMASNATTFTVSSIPATYQHLCLKWRLRSDVAGQGDGWQVRINGTVISSTSSTIRFGAYGNTSTSSLFGNTDLNMVLSTGNNFGSGHYSTNEIWIANYASSSSSNKILFTRNFWGGVATSTLGNLLNQCTSLLPTSSAINSVGLSTPDSGGINMLAGSKVWVYGIKTS